MPALPRRLKHIAFDINGVLIGNRAKSEIKKTIFDQNYQPKISQKYWDFVNKLSKSRFSAGIISNTMMVDQMIAVLRLKDYFNPLLFGYLLGYPKPHPKIFDDYINLVGLQPYEIAYVDNNKSNLIYMHTLGVFTIWINEHNRKRSYIIKNFVDLILPSVFDLQL